MRILIVSLFAAFVLAFSPTQADAAICVNVVESTCVESGLTEPLEPAVKSLLPPLVTVPDRAPVRPPQATAVPPVQPQPQSPPEQRTDAPKANSGAVEQKATSTTKSKPGRVDVTTRPRTPEDQPTEGRVIRQPDENGDGEVVVITEFRDYPWYFWVTFVFTIFAVAFLMFWGSGKRG